MYDLQLTPEQLQIRDTVRDFVADEVKPIAIRPERLEAPEPPLLIEILGKASRMGFRTLALSEENGGLGADNLTGCIVTEELAAGDADIAAILVETSRLGHLLFDRMMTPAQRLRFLPNFLADDRYHLALADHEPGTENHVGANYHRPSLADQSITTEAVQDGRGNWVINGAKSNIRNAPLPNCFLYRSRCSTSPAAGRSRPRCLSLTIRLD